MILHVIGHFSCDALPVNAITYRIQMNHLLTLKRNDSVCTYTRLHIAINSFGKRDVSNNQIAQKDITWTESNKVIAVSDSTNANILRHTCRQTHEWLDRRLLASSRMVSWRIEADNMARLPQVYWHLLSPTASKVHQKLMNTQYQ